MDPLQSAEGGHDRRRKSVKREGKKLVKFWKQVEQKITTHTIATHRLTLATPCPTLATLCPTLATLCPALVSIFHCNWPRQTERVPCDRPIAQVFRFLSLEKQKLMTTRQHAWLPGTSRQATNQMIGTTPGIWTAPVVVGCKCEPHHDATWGNIRGEAITTQWQAPTLLHSSLLHITASNTCTLTQ